MKYHTTSIKDEEKNGTIRKDQRRSFRADRKDNGKGWSNPSRNCPQGGGSEVQHQQDHAAERSCELRLFSEYSGMSGTGIESQSSSKKLKDAA